MADDNDLELESFAEEELEPLPEEEPSGSATRAARAMSARRPGPLRQLADKAAAPFSRVRLPEWNLLTFLRLLLILIILWFLLANWVPTRVHLLVINAELPKTILFLINLALGAVLLRWWQAYSAQRAQRKEAAESPPAELEDEPAVE